MQAKAENPPKGILDEGEHFLAAQRVRPAVERRFE
jgi:hypothetical protein